MLIVCPSCASSYTIPDEKLGANGRTVRCKRCATTWFAKPEADAAADTTADPFAAAVAAIDRAADSADEIVARAAGVAAAASDDPSLPSGTAGDAPSDAVGEHAPPDDVASQPAQHTADIDGEVIAASGRVDESPAADEAAPARRGVFRRIAALPSAGLAAVGRAAGRFRRAPVPEAEPVPTEFDAAPADPLSSPERLIPSRQDATARPVGPPKPSFGARAAPYAALAASLVAVVAVAARERIGEASPVAGRLFAAMGLGAVGADAAILNVTSEIAPGEEGEVLLVEGEVVNRDKTRGPTPPLRVSVRDDRGVELYAWPAQSLKLSLEPGERTVFRARLASPPPAGRTVKVRFESEPQGDARRPRAL